MHVCLLSRVEVTYLEGLTNPVPLKPLALNSTETAKNHILKKTKKKHVHFFFFLRERKQKCVKLEVSIPTAPCLSPLESLEGPHPLALPPVTRILCVFHQVWGFTP